MSEVEKLKVQLEYLKGQHFGAGATFQQLGEWMLEIAKLNLAIAELALKK